MREKLFKRLEKLRKENPEYVIGVDLNDEGASGYCLVKKIGKTMTVLLCKGINDKDEFELEVNNLAKYFNAKIIREKL